MATVNAMVGRWQLGIGVGTVVVGAVMLGGMALGLAGWALALRLLHPVCVQIDDHAVYLRRAGRTVASLPLRDLRLARQGERREDSHGEPTYWVGATLTAPGHRPVHLQAAARRTDLIGIAPQQAGGVLLDRPIFDGLMAELEQRLQRDAEGRAQAA